MSVIKSFSVGNGDMFYINHNNDNFTIIDCCLDDDNADEILDELEECIQSKEIVRFISTHPDEDHIRGLELLDDKRKILNFYCVANAAIKENETDSFNRYCELRDDPKKSFKIFKDCRRKWMNLKDDTRGSSGISILWPDTKNSDFKDALDLANEGESPNNISSIISYKTGDRVVAIWMGDLETDFMELIQDEVEFPETAILFAPHHGRDSGKVHEAILSKLNPKIIVIGEAPSEHLNYYQGYNTITQNTAGNIVFEVESDRIHVFSSMEYEADFLEDESVESGGYFYVGTLRA